MGDLLNPVHGQIEDVALTIINIGTSLTKHGKVAISVIPKAPYDNNVILLTPEHLENLAEKVGAFSRVGLANAINTGDDASVLHVQCTYKQAGKKIGQNPDGSPILNKEGGENHTVSYWDTGEFVLMPGVDATNNIKTVNNAIDIQEGLDRRKALKSADVAAKQDRLLARHKRSQTVTTPITGANPAVNPSGDESPI